MITPMTEFAVMATDGLWDVFEAQAVVNFICKRLGKRVQQVCLEIVDEALRRGSMNHYMCNYDFSLNRRRGSNEIS